MTEERERCMRQCVGNSSLYPSNHRMTLIVLIARYWNNPRVPQEGIFPMCFPAIRSPWSSLTVRSYGRRTESRTKQQSWTIIHKRDLRRFQRILRICLFRHSRYSAFCLLHLQALRHSFGLRLATINETKVWHWKSSFYFFSEATFDHLR